VDPQAADILLALRALLADFINRSVGQKPTRVHISVTDALSSLFSEHVASVDVDVEDEGEASNAGGQHKDGNGQSVLGNEDLADADVEIEDEDEARNVEGRHNDEDWQSASENEPRKDRPIAAGDVVKGYWPEDDAWLPAKVLGVSANGLLTISWDCDESVSDVPVDYVQRTKRARSFISVPNSKRGRHV